MNKYQISLGRVIRASAIAMTLLLTGCSSKSIPTPTITITNTPVAMATSTSAPVPTIAPKPDYVTDENSVQTDDGTVFVKDEKAMIYDPKTGEVKVIENISTDVTFRTITDALKIVLAMHADELTNQTRADFVPEELSKNHDYVKSIDRIAMSSLGEFGYAHVVGKNLESVKVKNPTKSTDFPEVAVIMLNVYGDKNPFPCIVGLFDAQGKFSPIQQTKDEYSATSYSTGHQITTNYPSDLSWVAYQQMVGDNIVAVSTLATIPVGHKGAYKDPWTHGSLSPKISAERDKLVAMQVDQAEDGFDYLANQGGVYQTGALYSAIESKSGDTGLIIVDMYGRLVIVNPSAQ